MTPRKEVIGSAELWLGDCREVLPTLGRVDAVVTDPPYGIGYRPTSRHTRPSATSYAAFKATTHVPVVGDSEPFDPSQLLAVKRAIIWGANNFAEKLPASNGWLVWDKTRGGTTCGDFHKGHAELAWTNFLGSVKIFDHMWDGCKRASEVSGGSLHPTQKPVALFEWCLNLFPADTQVVADPYMGVGACGVACARLGRSFIGCEIEPRYFDIACRRIEAAQRQADLFVRQPDAPKAKQEAML